MTQRRWSLAFGCLFALFAVLPALRPLVADAGPAHPFGLNAPSLTVSSDFLPVLDDPGAGAADPPILAQAPQGSGAPGSGPSPSIFGRRPLRQGSWEAGALAAFSISGAGGPRSNPVVRAWWLLPRVGYTFLEIPWYPASLQIYLEPAVAFIAQPAKTYILGVNAILRHTFLVWERFSPYIEGGAGLLNTNLRHRALAETIEFMPQVGAGFHIHVGDRVSLNAGYRWHHISNAGLGERNLGINSHFPYVGFTYFF